MKLFKALAVLALVLVIAAPAFAETQNVKVSGSLDAYYFYRDTYDLRSNNDIGAVAAGTAVGAGGGSGSLTNRSEGDSYFMSTTQLQVAADLTDNVSTVINLVNQRDWNADLFNTTTTPTRTAGDARTDEEFDIGIDLAYVQMKEIFYSPLTLTIGRQDIWWGRGFVIGNNLSAWDPQLTIQANEYSATTAFDAVRATLDFSPWTVDVIYSKINENAHDPEDDIDLYGANVNYKFAEYNGVAEGYWITEIDGTTLTAANGERTNDTHVLGGRVQFDPISQLTLGAELAYQWGDYSQNTTTPEQSRSAWGADIFGTYRFDNVWKPEVTLEYVLMSGDGNVGDADGFDGWNTLYRGKFWTAYADFREAVYATSDADDQPATTNQEFIQLEGKIKPMDDLALSGAYTYLWNQEKIGTHDEEIGWEIDLQAVYDYTEDVSFGLLAGWFVPGDFYSAPSDGTATDVVSSVKVTF